MDLWIAQFRRGLVELAVLAALRPGEAYGYELVERLQKAPGMELTESTVYPALTRLAKEGSVATRTAASPHGPPRRYYRLTEPGRRKLAGMIDHWNEVKKSMDTLIRGVES